VATSARKKKEDWDTEGNHISVPTDDKGYSFWDEGEKVIREAAPR